MIAILFGVYGLVLTVMGIFFAGPDTVVKAAFFVVWARMKPLNAGAPPADADADVDDRSAPLSLPENNDGP